MKLTKHLALLTTETTDIRLCPPGNSAVNIAGSSQTADNAGMVNRSSWLQKRG